MESSNALPAAPHAVRRDASLIGLVGLAHCISHFSQLLLAPLFPWLKDAFQVSYAELGLLMTVFFVVSCAVQALSGFVVDRVGPLPVLLGGLALITLAALGLAGSQNYWMLVAFFFFYAMALSGVQSFAPEAARLLHGVAKSVAAMCLTTYMVAAACGMVIGGFLVKDPARCERIVGIGFGLAAAVALTMA